jgi:DNA-binding MarR family transcriptional regulator
MPNNTVDTIVDNLFYVIPILHKKLMKLDPPDIVPTLHLSRLHLGILATLSESTLSSSEIARDFLIPKPQMTYLLHQMAEAGLIERQPNHIDHRVTNLTLTLKGREIFRQCAEGLKNSVRTKLSYLNDKELEEISAALIKLKEIGARLTEKAERGEFKAGTSGRAPTIIE